jgi:two-component system phosphate regulon sensor histidine kinase PhoR
MTFAAERIAGGDFDVTVAATSPEEFGVLGRSLTSLARQLKARIGELEEERAHVRSLLSMGREFMADASHELRTPVAAIQGYSETLLAGGVDEPTTKQFLETIHHHAVRLGRLVKDMLQLSALEARTDDKLVKEKVDLSGIAELVKETLEAPAAARRVTVELEAPAEIYATADPGAVEQILENLVHNAIKYGREGGRVRVAVAEQDGKTVLTVADDGEGIGKEHLPRLFDRFYRVDPGRSRDRGGTGLGLAIVKELANVMGGTVQVESDVGKGTTFTVELPRA